ncbi:LEA type 2 family protein [Pseudoxanthomonas sp. NC8]|nr:LEA type 2 family protein [Pseudoxanthomonas sp. NC8]
MKSILKLSLAAIAVLLLVSCTSARRVSPPATAIQQLAVQANGDWALDLRLHNYSSVSMRFDTVRLEVSVDEHVAGTLQATPAISIGPTSADVVRVTLKPDGMARIAVADALASRRSLAYRLAGTVTATPVEESKPREFEVDDHSSLNPAPGLDGVLR